MSVLVSVAENIPLGEAETLNLTLVVSVLVYVCHLVDRWPAQCVPCVSPSGCWDKPQISFLENVLKLWIAFNRQYIFLCFFFFFFIKAYIHVHPFKPQLSFFLLQKPLNTTRQTEEKSNQQQFKDSSFSNLCRISLFSLGEFDILGLIYWSDKARELKISWGFLWIVMTRVSQE